MKHAGIFFSSVVFTFTLLLAGVAAAQTKQPQPTLKETLEWMQSTLGGNGDEHIAGETRSVRLADFSECRVHFTYTTTKEGKDPYRADYSFNLVDVDPSYVVFHPYPGHIREGFGNFSAGIQNDAEKIKIHQGNMSNFTLSGITFDLDTDYGVRFTKAFEHAVNLCGGKSSITAFDTNAPYSEAPPASHPKLESKLQEPSQSASPHMDIPTLAKSTSGAIVSIIMSGEDGKPVAQGSGFLISNDGMILTNYHVIAEGSSAVVKFPDGTTFPVDGVLASDKVRDLAFIKIHGRNFQTLTLGNSDLVQVGEEVVAIGNPLALESTVSNGIISGLRTSEAQGGKFLQTTAPISPGSSGGPLFNMLGEVVGINSLYLEGGENLNFAIPINDAKHLLLAKTSKIQGLPNEVEPVKAQTQTAAQDGTIRVETQMAFVWGQDRANGAVSSHVTDPLTGQNLETFTYHGITITLKLRYFDCPWTGWCHTESYLTFINHSGNDITVRYGDTVLAGGKPMRLKQACVDCRETKAKDNPKNLDLLTGAHTIKDRTSYMVSLAFDWPYSDCRQSFFIDGQDFVFLIPPVGGSLQ